MAELYGKEEGEKRRRAKKPALIAAAALGIISVVLNVFFCIFMNRTNETLFRWIGIVSAIVLGWVALYLLLNVAFFDGQQVSFKLKALVREKSGKKDRIPGFIRKIGSQILIYLVFAFFAAVIWTFVFNLVTAVPVRQKLVVFIGADVSENALAEALEAGAPEGIKRVEVHETAYALFDATDINRTDLLILPESEIKNYVPLYLDLTEYRETHPDEEYYEIEEVPRGIRIEPGEAGLPASGMISYQSGTAYYVFFGALSTHASETDPSAFQLWEFFKNIP